MASTVPLTTGNPSQFSGFTHMERRADGLIVLEKTIDFAHLSAPLVHDVMTRARTLHPCRMAFLVTDREAFILHGGGR